MRRTPPCYREGPCIGDAPWGTMVRMTRTLGWLFLLMSLVLSGCQQVQQTGGKPRTTQVKTIVSLSPGVTEIISQTAYEIQILGRTRACNFPTNVPSIPVMADVKPNYEMIAAAKPDLIAYDAGLFNEKDIEGLKALKIPLFEYRANSLAEYSAACQAFSSIVGAEIRMSEFLDKIQDAQTYNMSKVPAKQPKVIVLMGDGKTEWMAAGLETFQADVVNKSGGVAVGPNSSKFEVVNVEALIGFAPDIILAPNNAAAILKDARLKDVPAIKNKRVADINPDILLRAGSRVNILLQQLGEFIRASE